MATEKFSDLNPVNGELTQSEINAYLTTHYAWVKNAEITKTPTTFLNGYEMPAAYRMKDLFMLVPGLVAAFGSQNGMNTIRVSSDSAKMLEKQKNV